MLELVRPSTRYKASYLAAIAEFHDELRFTYHQLDQLRRDFAAHVAHERARIHWENLPVFRVPETIYWLVDGEEYIGRLELRHELRDGAEDVAGHIGYSIRPSFRRRGYGTEILALGLQKAAQHGLGQVLLTCDPGNIASRRIIEHNGGRFAGRVDRRVDGIQYHKLLFWIQVPGVGLYPPPGPQAEQPRPSI